MTLRADIYGLGIGQFSGKKLGKRPYSGTNLKGKRSAESKRLKELNRQRELSKAAQTNELPVKIVRRKADPSQPRYLFW